MKKSPRLTSCNVFADEPAGRRFWRFEADDGKPKLEANITLPADKPAPPKLAARDWKSLFQTRVNIAWLPAGHVFLRVVQMPAADAAEIASMLEFQLEKLSPVPVAQVVWSFELIPSREINSVTAIVIVAERELVEAHVGALEKSGYQPDRLELPQLYQLLATQPENDGVWIYPWRDAERDFCIAAWWSTGTLRNLQVLHLPAGDARSAILEEQLMKTAWAGEVEGWVNFPLKWHVVAEPALAEEWRALFAWADGGVEVTDRSSADAMAQFAARRALRNEPAANLLPIEFVARYRQVLIDRLWMRGLGAIIGVYLAGVFIYFLAVQVLNWQASRVKSELASISNTYTNTLRMKEQVQILQDQLALKTAALDCWKEASDRLPEGMVLDWLNFRRGSVLELHGTADEHQKLSDYNDAMRAATVEGQPLFKSVSVPTSNTRPGAKTIFWSFVCELNRPETE